MTKENRSRFNIVRSKKAWLLASTMLMSTGVSEMTQKNHLLAHADDQSVSQAKGPNNEQFSPTAAKDNEKRLVDAPSSAVVTAGTTTAKTADSGQSAADSAGQQSVRAKDQEKTSSEDQKETVHDKTTAAQGGSEESNALFNDQAVKDVLSKAYQQDQDLLPESDLIVSKQDKQELSEVAKEILTQVSTDLKTDEKTGYSSNPNNDPLQPIYELTKTSSFEELVDKLGGYLPNFAYPGHTQMDEFENYVNQPAVMQFQKPAYFLFGLGGQQNDYSQVSYMRLKTDKAFVKSVADKLKKLANGGAYEGTSMTYLPVSKTLAYSGGLPFYAVLQSSNGSLLSPNFYLTNIEEVMQSIGSIATGGRLHSYIDRDYEDGRYGIYLRLEAPEGTDPNTFVKMLNLDKAKFGAQMDFNVNFGIDKLMQQIPGIDEYVQRTIGVSLSGYQGSVLDLLTQSALWEINHEAGTHVSEKGAESPFYPITLYPNDIKTNVKEDPRGVYLLVRGAELSQFDSTYLKAKIMVTKFVMNSMAWVGDIAGAAYGYLNFDVDRYEGNPSAAELKQNGISTADPLMAYADNSPYKILTRGQLPPHADGRLTVKANSIDANGLVSSKKHSWPHGGNFGTDLAVVPDKIHDHALQTSPIATWRAYISPIDQKHSYNLKKVTASSAEWVEEKGQREVLPGRDFDNRRLILDDGDSFYGNRDRFDRVIDYFTGDVLLDKDGFHENDQVQSIKLVKSTDPDGQLTKESDFAIYNRPFTVYYSGETTLSSGERIPLRTTKMTVVQQDSKHVDLLTDLRQDTMKSLEEQAKVIKNTASNMANKLKDDQLAKLLVKQEQQLAEVNRQMEDQKTEDGIFDLAVTARHDLLHDLDGLANDENFASGYQKGSLAAAIKEVHDWAYNQTIHINDDQTLSFEQKQKTIEKMNAFVEEALKELVKAADQEGRSKRKARFTNDFSKGYYDDEAQAIIDRLNKLFPYGDDDEFIADTTRNFAVMKLAEAGDLKKTEFYSMDHLDPDSLSARCGDIDKIVDEYTEKIKIAKKMSEIRDALTKAELLINAVGRPDQQPDFMPASNDDREAAKQTLHTVSAAKKTAFAAIAHVDPVSLAQQNVKVDQTVRDAEFAIDQAETKGEVKQALNNGLEALEKVANPLVEDRYQPVTKEDRLQAKAEIDAAADTRGQEMAAIAHVDQDSLTKQVTLLKAIVDKAKNAIDAANSKYDLKLAVEQGLKNIDQLADPAKEAAYRKPDPADQAAAKKGLTEEADAKKDSFDQLDGVDEESLADAKKKVDQVLLEAIDEVDQAKSAADVDDAYRKGLKAIDAVPAPAVIEENKQATEDDKKRAEKKLTDVVNRKKAEFGQIQHVDFDSLNTQKNLIDTTWADGLENIEQAKTKGDVAKALANAKKSIAAIATPSLERDYRQASQAAKNRSIKRLEIAANTRKSLMDQIAHVDQDSLVAQKKQVDDVLKVAQDAVRDAYLNKDVDVAEKQGMTDINAVSDPQLNVDYRQADDVDRKQAKETLDQAGDLKKTGFRNIPNVDLSSLNKQAEKVDRVVNDGKEAIDAAKTNGEMNLALDKALNALDQIPDPMVQTAFQPASDLDRATGIKQIEDAKKAKKIAFNKIDHVDQDDLKSQLAEIDDAVLTAKEHIEKASTKGQVDQAVRDGLAAIQDVLAPDVEEDYRPVTAAEKNNAKNLIDRAVDFKKQTFSKIDHVDPDSLSEQSQSVEEAGSNAKTAIEQASIQSELKNALDAGLTNIGAVADPSLLAPYLPATPDSKDSAKQSIDHAGADKKQRFDGLPGVDPTDLDKQKKAVDAAAEKAKSNIDHAGTQGDVDKAYRDGLADIDQVPDPAVVDELKPASEVDRESEKTRLTGIANQRKNYFDSIPHTDFVSLKTQRGFVDLALTAAMKAIDQAKTRGQVAFEGQKGEAAIMKVSEPSLEAAYRPANQEDRNRATAVLYAAADRRVKDFEAFEHVDEASLTKQKKAVYDAEETGTQNIQAATTKGAVDHALRQGLQAVADVKAPRLAHDYVPATDIDREAAKGRIMVEANQRKSAIDRVVHAKKESVVQQKKLVDGITMTANGQIEMAKTNGDLDRIVQEAIQDIKQVPDPVLDDDYRPASDEMKKLYEDRLLDLANKRRLVFENIEHVDDLSLYYALKELGEAAQAGDTNIQEAKTNVEVLKAYHEAVEMVQKVAAPQVEYGYQKPTQVDIDAEITHLRRGAENRKDVFRKIEYVDPKSLEKQCLVLDHIVDKYIAIIEQASTRHALVRIHGDFMGEIADVPEPDLLPGKDFVTDEELDAALDALDKVAKDKEKTMRSIPHVDADSLKDKLAILNIEHKRQDAELYTCERQYELRIALVYGISKINDVPNPDVEWGYRSLSEAAKKNAIQELVNLASQKKRDFDSLAGVKLDSLKRQKQLVDEALQRGENNIQPLKLNRELAPVMAVARGEIQMVERPDIDRDHALPTAIDRTHAKQVLTDSADAKKSSFDMVPFVQEEALARQKQVVDDLLADFLKQVDESQTLGELDRVVEAGQKAINEVANPASDADHQKPTKKMIQKAIQEVRQAGRERKNEMAEVKNVVREILRKQQKMVTALVNSQLPALRQSETVAELNRTKSLAIYMIQNVPDPDANAATRADRRRAKARVNNAAKVKTKLINKVENPNQDEKTEILSDMADVVSETSHAIDAAEKKEEVLDAALDGVERINNLPLPTEGHKGSDGGDTPDNPGNRDGGGDDSDGHDPDGNNGKGGKDADQPGGQADWAGQQNKMADLQNASEAFDSTTHMTRNIDQMKGQDAALPETARQEKTTENRLIALTLSAMLTALAWGKAKGHKKGRSE
ncbi:DUF1542 domain-containing protein [Fructobacillus sp. M1-13]|uniref:DUF1542 domain-containing protein n=1 Tax=Fructobacillus papyriferae TaxID=2713171 RepID=A0ABS5QNT2_9LACO|nr:DUF1542 domain-containing protein [Fructobacillus papyriferae]MBS9334804.1 DUF1542 domain-containing protein [Fructobacillus papyriferae]MCD2158794.1 DUF1542 domain-containing protein [Fructobacillus papyriferae]